MINIHLNGEIVKCPDIRAIQARKYEYFEKNSICKFGIHEDNCSAWNNHFKSWQNIKERGACGRCSIAGTLSCPGTANQKKIGTIKKQFNINSETYRKMSSAAHDMIKTSEFKTLFLTLTLPTFKDKKNEPSEKDVNKCFSKFVENLRKNYNCSGYIAVRERGTDNNRLHYHIICSVPFIPFNTLNSAWCAALSDICDYSKCAIRSTKKTLYVRNPGTALRYVCKYFSKCRGQRSDTRLVFMSRNLITKPIQRNDIILTDLLKPYKGIYINKTSDYSIVFRVTDQKSFMSFCNEFLYPAFSRVYENINSVTGEITPRFTNKPANFYVPGPG